MSTYWYLDVDAPLRVTDADARQAFGRALANIGHHLDDGTLHFPDLNADGLPFQVTGKDDRPPVPLPEEGWTVVQGRLHAFLFVEDLTRATSDDPASLGHRIVLGCLADILAAEPCAVVGGLASENAECRGPLVRIGDAVRWLPSTASHPGRGYDLGPDLDPVERIPPDLMSDASDGLTCDADPDALIQRIKAVAA